MQEATRPTPTRRLGLPASVAYVALLVGIAATTLAVAKVPFTGDPNPVVERFSGPQFIVLAVSLCVAASAWALAWATGSIRLPRSRALPALGVFALVAVISTLNADVLPLAIVGESGRYLGLITWLCCVAAFVISAGLFDTSRSRVLMDVLISVGAVEAVIGLSQALGADVLGFDFPEAYDWMLAQGVGTLGNPNHLAAVLVVPLVLSIHRALVSDSWPKRAAYLMATTVMSGSLVASATRAAWIGSLAGVVLLVVWSLRKHDARRTSVVLALCIAVAGSALGIAVADRTILGTRFDAPTSVPGTDSLDRLSNGRLTLWRQTLEAAGSRVLLGTGPDSMRNAFYADGLVQFDPNVFADDPHSLPLAVLVSFGAVGCIALAYGGGVVLLQATTRAADKQTPGETRALTAAALAWTVTSLLSVLSIPFLLTGFVVLGALAHRDDPEPSTVTGSPMLLAVPALVALLGLAAIWCAGVPLKHNLAITAAPLTVPLSAHDSAVLEAADAALPWRYEMMVRRADRIVRTAEIQAQQGDIAGARTRLEDLLSSLDARTKQYPAEYFAWQTRARSYASAASILQDPELAQQAVAVGSKALESFPGDRTLGDIVAFAMGL